ncbi:MAG: RNA pseudouridine synthase [Bacteroidia bacterium]|nr:RNA pseudouridine synthase [Bacteroidia bacterium]MDW8088324.1 RNA pseudouridine synthase [Bacteroidia bacterium]
MEPKILAQTPQDLVLLKPAGMPAQADATGDLDLLRWAQAKTGEKLYLVHRLDRPVGGVMLLARQAARAAYWSRRFRQHKVRKAYLAITQPPIYPPFGQLTHYLRKDPQRHRAIISLQPFPQAQLARLQYQTLAEREGHALLLIEPQTGRFHQIRAQLAALGSPIIGDVKYGYLPPAPDPHSIALWAWRLEDWVAPPPLSPFPWQLFAPILKKFFLPTS